MKRIDGLLAASHNLAHQGSMDLTGFSVSARRQYLDNNCGSRVMYPNFQHVYVNLEERPAIMSMGPTRPDALRGTFFGVKLSPRI
jgi:hypothetical protein